MLWLIKVHLGVEQPDHQPVVYLDAENIGIDQGEGKHAKKGKNLLFWDKFS